PEDLPGRGRGTGRPAAGQANAHGCRARRRTGARLVVFDPAGRGQPVPGRGGPARGAQAHGAPAARARRPPGAPARPHRRRSDRPGRSAARQPAGAQPQRGRRPVSGGGPVSAVAGPGGLQIAIDGPSGTGKSTASRRLAAHLGGAYLDTGAMYRVATLHVLESGIDLADVAAVAAAVRTLPIEVGSDPLDEAVLLAGRDVRAEIRGADVTAHVSAVSALPEVRDALVQAQRG